MPAEGSTIRSIERMTGLRRDTAMRLRLPGGEGCQNLMDAKMCGLSCKRIEANEIWGFIGAKRKNAARVGAYGDVWTFVAFGADSNLSPAPAPPQPKNRRAPGRQGGGDGESRGKTTGRPTADLIRKHIRLRQALLLPPHSPHTPPWIARNSRNPLDSPLEKGQTVTAATHRKSGSRSPLSPAAPAPGAKQPRPGTTLHKTFPAFGFPPLPPLRVSASPLSASALAALPRFRFPAFPLSAFQTLLIESADEGAVGLQLKSLISPNNWQLKLHGDAVTIGKVGVADYLTISPAGVASAPSGYAVGPAVGLSTNMQVLTPGPKTNTLVFTKGLLTAVQ